MNDTITVRTNLYLWMLTGRTDDFANPSLNTGLRYSIKNTPAEVEQVRALLHLDVVTTDFHVLSALAAARMSTALLRQMPRENDAVFDGGTLVLPSFAAVEELTRYPFKETADILQNSSVAVRLMAEEGTLQAFSESTNQAKRVGMAALAIIRCMIKAINDDQAGFSVESYYDADSDEPLERRYEIDPAFVDGLTDPVVDEEAPVGFDA